MIKIIRTKATEKKRKRYVPERPFWKEDTFTEKSAAKVKNIVSKAIDDNATWHSVKRGDDYRLK
jgi:hypothetical protein